MSPGDYTQRQVPLAPKPYDFVPFPQSVTRRPLPHGIETLCADDGFYSGNLTLVLETLTPLFVASGRYELSEDLTFSKGAIARGCYRIGGQPTIPAASLKGCVRSVAEAVSPSHVSLTKVDIPRHLKDTGQCRAGDRSCPACALFGTGGTKAHISLVRFEDALPAGEAKTSLRSLIPLHAPQASGQRLPPAYVDKYGVQKGRKFYFHNMPADGSEGDRCEVVQEKTLFMARMSFINLEGPLLGVLFFALSLDGTFRLKLGGGKPLGFGSIALTAIELRLLSSACFMGSAERGAMEGADLAEFVIDMLEGAKAEELLLEPQVEKLREILRWPTSRVAVTEPY